MRRDLIVLVVLGVGLTGLASHAMGQSRRTVDRFARPVAGGAGVVATGRVMTGVSAPRFSAYEVNRLPEILGHTMGVQAPVMDEVFTGEGEAVATMPRGAARYFPQLRDGQRDRCTPSRAMLLAPVRPPVGREGVVVQRGGESWGQGTGVAVPARGYSRGAR